MGAGRVAVVTESLDVLPFENEEVDVRRAEYEQLDLLDRPMLVLLKCTTFTNTSKRTRGYCCGCGCCGLSWIQPDHYGATKCKLPLFITHAEVQRLIFDVVEQAFVEIRPNHAMQFHPDTCITTTQIAVLEFSFQSRTQTYANSNRDGCDLRCQ